MTESNLNLSQGSDDMPFSAPNIEQALDILTAEAGNLSDAQYQETALANVNLLRDLMHQSGVTPMSMPAPMKTPAPGSTAERAMDVASRVQNLGFVEFTAGLINGTFDAIIGATIKQMEAYADLVADVAKTLEQFQAENVSEDQINAHLSDRYPDGLGGTSIRSVPAYEFTETKADADKGVTAKTAMQNMLAVVDALVLETKGLESTNKLTRVKLGFLENTTGVEIPPTRIKMSFSKVEVELIRKAIGMKLATSMMSHLRAMAREGMARIVITEGSINTKLTFKVDTTETLIKQEAQYSSNSRGGSVSGYYAGKKWGISGGFANSRINIKTVNETNYNHTNMVAEMIGEVNIKFRTETFAPYEAPIVTPTP